MANKMHRTSLVLDSKMESQMSQDSDSGQVETTEAMDDTSGAQAIRPSEQTNEALSENDVWGIDICHEGV